MANTATLDCENFHSSIKCLADAHAATISDVEAFLYALDLDERYQASNISAPGVEYLASLFQSHFGHPIHTWDNICWFHLTRVPANTDFAEGILPLRLALDAIWRTVISVQDDSRKRAILESLRDTGVPDHQYKLKAGVALHDGPHAMLVRESAFHSGAMGNHDYLQMPEIIEDICNGYERHTGERIVDRVANALKPCIVKFQDSEREGSGDDSDVMRVVLYYCWSKCRNEELCYLANTCFDARGRVIPRSAIHKIEFV
jgi:hypothetical protein